MHLDDFSDFLQRVKRAEELGLTAAEVWRTAPIQIAEPCVCIPQDHTHDGPCIPRTDLERCARCKRETAPENGYKTGAGFFCSVCSSEFDDGVK